MTEDRTIGLQPGDRLQLKKKHPCQADCFTVVRAGADIKLRCEGCGREFFLERAALNSRIRKVLYRGEQKKQED